MSALGRLRDRWLPRSIVARMSLVLFVGILIAQTLGAALWARQVADDERKRLVEVSENLGARVGQTLQFFSRLPDQYRHIVLDQLRDMGGTRFFVSVNRQLIDLNQLPTTDRAELSKQVIARQLQAQTGPLNDLSLQLVAFGQLKILSGNNLMVDLPLRWKRFALVNPGDQSPVVVIQHRLNTDEWIYVAAVLPVGEAIQGSQWLTPERLWSLTLVSLTVLALTTALVRWIVGPLRLLARQADALGRGQTPELIVEQGSREMVSTIRAFNVMGLRTHKFIADRERLFASISHDLKTPLTRARLRAEMLPPEQGEPLIRDLENLDVMVKGALQMMKEGAIHENPEPVELKSLLSQCLQSATVAGVPSSLTCDPALVIQGRRLALERVFSNLIDNAVHYGRSIDVSVRPAAGAIELNFKDRGPGIPDALKSKVFDPYFRAQHSPSTIHVGLGMGIVRSLVQQHGGTIELSDRTGGGLVVRLLLPLSHFDTNRNVEAHPAP